MSWESSIKEFKYYLRIARSLADNTIESYLRDINKLAAWEFVGEPSRNYK